ncbi:MAG: hypothetical protein COC12_00225 [Rhodobacteraceae bacterium]|nr:MAG: hypothetical protein COC12_00225 [Paracoccaceae bacterium]
MEEKQETPDTRAFAGLLDQVAALHEGTGGTATAGHYDLGPDLWLSADPAGQAVMGHVPCEGGVRLSLEAGDSGAWVCLGMRLPVEILRNGRYLGLLVEARAESLLSFTPTLRYFPKGGGLQDVPVPAPVLLAGGAHEHLSYIPIDPERLEAAWGCELNLFFHNDVFTADFSRIEPLLIW